MATEKLRIILNAGFGRSGSTLLDNVLGQTQGFFSSGELGNLWDFARPSARVCACGTRLRECPTWNGIFRRLYGDVEMAAVLDSKPRDPYRFLRLRDLWRLSVEPGRKRFLQLASDHAREAVDVYRAISEEAGANHHRLDQESRPGLLDYTDSGAGRVRAQPRARPASGSIFLPQKKEGSKPA